MKRRSRAGGEPIKGRRRKAAEPKRRNAPKGVARPKFVLCCRENGGRSAYPRTERSARAADGRRRKCFRVISRSHGDLQPVFPDHAGEGRTPLRSQVWEYLPLGRRRFNASCDAQYPCRFGRGPQALTILRFGRKNPVGHMIATKSVVHVDDVAASEAYIENDPATVAAVELGGARTFVAVPMLKENELLGAFALARQEVRPFTDRQIELVKNFAAQAVIAIENARLLNELRQSLEQQTANSEVLQVISSSPGDLQPVFESMLRNATQLCKAKFGTLFLHEQGKVRLVAAYDMPMEFSEGQARGATEPAPGGPLEGALKTKRAVQIADLAATDAYRQRHPRMVGATAPAHR